MTKNFALGICLATSLSLAANMATLTWAYSGERNASRLTQSPVKPAGETKSGPSTKIALSSGQSSSQEDSAADKSYERLVDEFFDFVFDSYPSWGTTVGLHQYDQKLEDFSPEAVKKLKAVWRISKNALPTPLLTSCPWASTTIWKWCALISMTNCLIIRKCAVWSTIPIATARLLWTAFLV